MIIDKKDYVVNTNVAPHTIKKFDLISRYVDEWARKILGFGKSNGIVFIDCMSNSGIYKDSKGNIVKGTPIRVAECLCEIMSSSQYSRKKALVVFNDKEKDRIDTLESILKELSLPSNMKINYSVNDSSVFLKSVPVNKINQRNILLLYDPYQAIIDWEAVSPFLNTWGELILNHMIQDTVRGVGMAKSQNAIQKYQETYKMSIDELIALDNDRNKLEEIIEKIMKAQSKKQANDFISSFPFYNANNALIYNLIHFTHNIEGLKLFKKVAWQTFGGYSSAKKTKNNPAQLIFDFETNIGATTQTDVGCYSVNDIAKYVVKQFKGQSIVSKKIVWEKLEQHPIFPTDGFKKEITEALKSIYGIKTVGCSDLDFSNCGG